MVGKSTQRVQEYRKRKRQAEIDEYKNSHPGTSTMTDDEIICAIEIRHSPWSTVFLIREIFFNIKISSGDTLRVSYL